MGVTRKRRETYARCIGKHFGFAIVQGIACDRIYEGAYYDPDTGKKQYNFVYKDMDGNVWGNYLTDYKGFRKLYKEEFLLSEIIRKR